MKLSTIGAAAIALFALSFAPAVTARDAAAPAAVFTPCADAGDLAALAGSLCLTETVALDPVSSADGGQAQLFVRKFPAANPARRRGAIWLVAGGPGESGASFYPLLPVLRRAFPDLDLVIPDHRGTGFSTKLCPDEEATDSGDGIALAGDEWGPCIGSVHADAARAHDFTVTHAAHDLATLIERHRAPGRTYVYGVSYGTQLALRMMAVRPTALDGLILDGLVPQGGAVEGDLGRRTAVVDKVGRSLLTRKQTAALTRVLAQPNPAWRAVVPGGDLRQLLGTMLNFPSVRAQIPAIVAALDRGDTAPLEAAIAAVGREAGALGGYPQSPASLPLVILVSGSENNDRRDLTAAAVAAEAKDALFTSPLPGFLASAPLPLYARDAWYGRLPARLPPTLVMQGTLDPNTPYDAARSHARAFANAGRVRFATVERGAHFLALVAPGCFVRLAGSFAAKGRAPRRCVAAD